MQPRTDLAMEAKALYERRNRRSFPASPRANRSGTVYA